VLVRSMPDPPRITEGGSSASYRPSSDLISIPPLKFFKSPDAFYATLFMSWGTQRDTRSDSLAKGSPERCSSARASTAGKELVAELTAAFCCATVSLDHSLIEDSAGYIDNWLHGTSLRPKGDCDLSSPAQRATTTSRVSTTPVNDPPVIHRSTLAQRARVFLCIEEANRGGASKSPGER